jgi:DMSO/TMAO reductase YedYZ molybdopterin-dependent catalytic subunit
VKRIIGLGVFVGLLLTAALTAVLYLGDQAFGLPFVPFAFFDWITRILPGPLITFGIDLMIDTMLALNIGVADTAKTAEQISAVLQFLLMGVTVAAAAFALFRTRHTRPDPLTGLAVGALFGLPLAAISTAIGQATANPAVSIVALLALFLAWGVALAWSYNRLNALAIAEPADAGEAAVESLDRRQFLIRLGAATATITVAGAGVGSLLAQASRRRLEETLAGTAAHNTETTSQLIFPNTNDPVVPVPGTRPEYTPLKDHYKVFIRTEPTVIDGAAWVMPIAGLVENPLMLTLDDLRNNYTARDQYVTLSCISGRVGTDLIGTTLWTGVSLQELLADAKPAANAKYLFITCGDGFYETVSLDLIDQDERIMLAYAWDGQPIPSDHGFPLRIYIPDRFGMKQPKWITSIEVTDQYIEGYWVERGWDEVARMNATSVIDVVAVDHIIANADQQLVPIGGIAHAGARGISRVEVKVDDGPWQEAQLRSPLSETTWVLWRYDWPFTAGHHTFRVRCADGDGTPQIEEPRGARPSGSTGIHKREADL